MRKFILLLAMCHLITMTMAQTNAEIIGKTVTDSIQIINGATTGHILQSADGMGLGEWVNPTTLGDDLGNHTATMKIKMDGNSIEGLDTITFKNGQKIDQSTAGTLQLNSHLDLRCNNLDNVTAINFCPTAMGAMVSSIVNMPSAAPGIALSVLLYGFNSVRRS